MKKKKLPVEVPALPTMMDADDMRFVQETLGPKRMEINVMRALTQRLMNEFTGMESGFRQQAYAKYKLGPYDGINLSTGAVIRGKKPESVTMPPADAKTPVAETPAAMHNEPESAPPVPVTVQ